jgi:hypothetical protein
MGAWLVIAALAIGLVAYAALHPQRSPVPTGADPADWRGRTAQGLAATATINGRWLDDVSVQVRLSCDRGAKAETFVWTPSSDLFTQEGDVVTARESPQQLAATDGWQRSFDGELRMVVGDRPHGTASVRLTWVRGETQVLCRSGPVAFSLRREAT